MEELPVALTVATARRIGLTRAQVRTEIRRGRWQPVAPGLVVTHGGDLRRSDWVEVGAVLAGARGGVTGWDALQLRDLVGRVRAPTRVLALTRDGRSRTIGPVLVRRTDRRFRVESTGPDHPQHPFLPLVATPRAVADAALECDRRDDVTALVARAVQRGRCDVAELRAELASGPRGGSAHLRVGLEEVAAGARSVAEAHALRSLRRGRVGGFELNVPIVDGHSRVVFVVDVLWRALRAVLEIDSVEYHWDRAAWARTLARHAQLTSAGLSVLHFPPSAVRSPGWVEQVRTWLERRAVELGLDPAAIGADPTGAGAVAAGRVDPGPLLVPGILPVR